MFENKVACFGLNPDWAEFVVYFQGCFALLMQEFVYVAAGDSLAQPVDSNWLLFIDLIALFVHSDQLY